MTSTSSKPKLSIRRTTKFGERKCSRATKQVVRKRRRVLPPPLLGTARNAQPRKPPHRGPFSTLAGCIYACRAEALPQRRRPRKKNLINLISISMDAETEIIEWSATSRTHSMLLNSEQLAGRSDRGNVSKSDYSNISKASNILSFGSTSVERKIRSHGSSKVGSPLLIEGKEGGGVSKAGSSNQWKSGDSLSIFDSSSGSLYARSLVKLNANDEASQEQDIPSGSPGEHEELLSEKHFKVNNNKKKKDNIKKNITSNTKDDKSNRSSSTSSLLKTLFSASETQRFRSSSKAAFQGLSLETEGNDSLKNGKTKRKFLLPKVARKNEGTNAEKELTSQSKNEGSASKLETSQFSMGNAESGLSGGSLNGSLKTNTAAKNLIDAATGKTHVFNKYTPCKGYILGENELSNLMRASTDTSSETNDRRDGLTAKKSRQAKEGLKSGKTAISQDKKKKETATEVKVEEEETNSHPKDIMTAPQQVMESSAPSKPMARRKNRECMTLAPVKIKKGVVAHSKQQEQLKISNETRKELSTSLEHYKSKTSAEPTLSSGETGEKKSPQEEYVISMLTSTSTLHPTAGSQSSSTQIGHQEKQEQGRKKMSKGSKDSSDSNGTIHLPRLTASSLHSSLISSSRVDDVSENTEELLPVALSARGCDLLERLQQNVLQYDSALQRRLQSLREEAKMRKKAKSPLGTTLVSALATSTSGDLSTIGSHHGDIEFKEGYENEEEEEEDMEDVIAILRWLADRRRNKLLTDNRFNLAVESIRENTTLPFFLCEGNTAGGAPTLIVRLPRAADEAVVIPLVDDTPLEMDTVTEQVQQEYGENTKVQLRTITTNTNTITTTAVINNTVDLCGNVPMVSRPPNLPMLTQDEKGKRRREMEREQSDDTTPPVVSRKKNGQPRIYMAYAKLPRSHFNGCKELPEVLDAAFKTRSWQKTSLHYRVIQDFNDTQAAHPYRPATMALHSSNVKDSRSLVFSNTVIRHTERLLPFNPANPQESSPYNKSPGVAAYIATGTKNFMV